MKNKEDVCLVVQARLGSERLPGKMLKPFAESNLVDILFKKLKKLKNIPQIKIFSRFFPIFPVNFAKNPVIPVQTAGSHLDMIWG